MKKYLFFSIIFLLFLCTSASSQIKLVRYFDKDWKPCGKEVSSFYRILYKDAKGKIVGITKDFYKNGKLQWQGKLISENPDLNDSTCVWYFANGKPESITHFKNGIKHGWDIDYFSDGFIDSTYYENDNAISTYKKYDAKNNLISYSSNQFKNGKRNGWYIFNDHGAIDSTYYVNDKQEGLNVSYDKEGRMTLYYQKSNGLNDGKYLEFENGVKVRDEFYVKGKPEGWNITNKNGVLDSAFYFNGLMEGKSVQYKNGIKQMEGFYKGGIIEGTRTNWRDDGTIYYVENFNKGKLNGKQVWYFEDGSIGDSMYMVNDTAIGLRIHYDLVDEKKIRKETLYIKGREQEIKTFDENGKAKQATINESRKFSTINFDGEGFVKNKEVRFNSYDTSYIINYYPKSTQLSDSSFHFKYQKNNYKAGNYYRWHLNGSVEEIKEIITKNGELFVAKHLQYNSLGKMITELVYDSNETVIHKDYDQCLYGLRNKNKKWVVLPIYSSISKFQFGYFIVYVNEKMGLIDRKGNVIIPPVFDEINAVVIKNPTIDSVAAPSFNHYDLERGLSQFYYYKPIQTFYLKVALNNKYGVFNNKGEKIIDTIYDNARDNNSHQKEVLLLLNRKNETVVLYTNGDKTFFPYSEISLSDSKNYFVVKNTKNDSISEKWGLANRYGKLIGNLIYDEYVGQWGKFFVFKMINDDTLPYKLIDTNGVELLSWKDRNDDMRHTHEGYFIYHKYPKYTLYDENLKPVLPGLFDYIYAYNSDSIYFLTQGNKLGWYLPSYKKYFTTKYDELILLKSGHNLLLAKKDGWYGIINFNDSVVKKFIYNSYNIDDYNYLLLATNDSVEVYSYSNLKRKKLASNYFWQNLKINYKTFNNRSLLILLSGKIKYGITENVSECSNDYYQLRNKKGETALINNKGDIIFDYGKFWDFDSKNSSGNINLFCVQSSTGLFGIANKYGNLMVDTLYSLLSEYDEDNNICWVVEPDAKLDSIANVKTEYNSENDEDNNNYNLFPGQGRWKLYDGERKTLSKNTFEYPYAFEKGFVFIPIEVDSDKSHYRIFDGSGNEVLNQAIEKYILRDDEILYLLQNVWYSYKIQSKKIIKLSYDDIHSVGENNTILFVSKKGNINLLDEDGVNILTENNDRIIQQYKIDEWLKNNNHINQEEMEYAIFNKEAIKIYTSFAPSIKKQMDSVVFALLSEEYENNTYNGKPYSTMQIYGNTLNDYYDDGFGCDESNKLSFSLEKTTNYTYQLSASSEYSRTCTRGAGVNNFKTNSYQYYIKNNVLKPIELQDLFFVNSLFKSLLFKQVNAYKELHDVSEIECSTPELLYDNIGRNFTINNKGIELDISGNENDYDVAHIIVFISYNKLTKFIKPNSIIRTIIAK